MDINNISDIRELLKSPLIYNQSPHVIWHYYLLSNSTDELKKLKSSTKLQTLTMPFSHWFRGIYVFEHYHQEYEGLCEKYKNQRAWKIDNSNMHNKEERENYRDLLVQVIDEFEAYEFDLTKLHLEKENILTLYKVEQEFIESFIEGYSDLEVEVHRSFTENTARLKLFDFCANFQENTKHHFPPGRLCFYYKSELNEMIDPMATRALWQIEGRASGMLYKAWELILKNHYDFEPMFRKVHLEDDRFVKYLPSYLLASKSSSSVISPSNRFSYKDPSVFGDKELKELLKALKPTLKFQCHELCIISDELLDAGFIKNNRGKHDPSLLELRSFVMKHTESRFKADNIKKNHFIRYTEKNQNFMELVVNMLEGMKKKIKI